MTHPEAAIAALFDHEQEQPGAPTRGRERPAPDWGGDELFSSTPRRRRPRPRTRDFGEHHLYAVPTPAHEDAVTATLELEPAPAPEPALEAVAASVESVEFAEIAPPAGRRTVTVTGHPEPRVVRPRRPAPTVDQRIGHRPDRIAGWAFALGMLLILIAIITANMG